MKKFSVSKSVKFALLGLLIAGGITFCFRPVKAVVCEKISISVCQDEYIFSAYVMYGDGAEKIDRQAKLDSMSGILILGRDGYFFFQKTKKDEASFLDFPDYETGTFTIKNTDFYWEKKIDFYPDDADKTKVSTLLRFDNTISAFAKFTDLKTGKVFQMQSSELTNKYKYLFFREQ